jgi:hypothetical protein
MTPLNCVVESVDARPNISRVKAGVPSVDALPTSQTLR